MKSGAKSIIVLTVICLVISGLLAAVNHVTSPIIEKAEAEATTKACKEVMKDAKGFESVAISNAEMPKSIKEIYKDTAGNGYVFKVSGKGYDQGLVVVCGIDSTGKITGTAILSSNETPSIGGQCNSPSFLERFMGKTKTEIDGVQGISGATLTSTGFRNALKDAYTAFEAVKEKEGK